MSVRIQHTPRQANAAQKDLWLACGGDCGWEWWVTATDGHTQTLNAFQDDFHSM